MNQEWVAFYGIPKGFLFGLVLFSLYITPLSKIIGTHPYIKFHFYADDGSHMSTKKTFQPCFISWLMHLTVCLLMET